MYSVRLNQDTFLACCAFLHININSANKKLTKSFAIMLPFGILWSMMSVFLKKPFISRIKMSIVILNVSVWVDQVYCDSKIMLSQQFIFVTLFERSSIVLNKPEQDFFIKLMWNLTIKCWITDSDQMDKWWISDRTECQAEYYSISRDKRDQFAFRPAQLTTPADASDRGQHFAADL